MNYIRHLNAFFTRIKNDDRLTATHVSLYLALFQYWNFNRFQNPFPVYRDNIMQLSKLGSKNTYHKCIKELHAAGYIIYHPAASKYQPVKIRIIRLDVKEQSNNFKQLNLFSNQLEHVPDLTGASTINETQHVPNMGHHIKQNILENSVEHPPTKIVEKEKVKSPAIGGGFRGRPPHVPKMRHVPNIEEINQFFKEQHYDPVEAGKFFYYNQAKNWMLTEKIPIYDWKALAHKWMLNERERSSELVHKDLDRAIQFLYEQFLQGERINKYLLPEYADHLQLTITNAIKQEAIQRRINQLSGTNENKELQLWNAYMNEDFSNDIVTKDEPNLIALAKRLAVSKHFQKLKSQNQKNILSS